MNTVEVSLSEWMLYLRVELATSLFRKTGTKFHLTLSWLAGGTGGFVVCVGHATYYQDTDTVEYSSVDAYAWETSFRERVTAEIKSMCGKYTREYMQETVRGALQAASVEHSAVLPPVALDKGKGP